MDISQVITAFGLAGSAGLNAYIPLLLVSVLGKLGVIHLNAPFDVLSNPLVMVALVVLLVIEVAVDKVPGADHVNDVLQTLVRPAAGAILFAGNSGAIGNMSPELSLALGLVMAFGVHAAKAAARPVVNATTLGIGAPVISVAEDVTSLVGSLLAIFLPLVFLIFVGVIAFLIYRVSDKFKRAFAK